MSKAKLRSIAADILVRVECEHAYATIALAQLENERTLEPQDIRVIQKLVRGVLETRASLDSILAELLVKRKSKLPPYLVNVLRIALYQLRYLDRVPDHVVVNESVALMKASKYPKMAGLVNAVLRREIRETPKIISSGCSGIAEELNHPKWMIERWTNEFGRETAIEICRANNRAWPLFLRVNTLRLSLLELQEELRAEGLESEPAPYAHDCLVVRRLPSDLRLHELKAFKSGLFFIQDESSILVTELVAAKPGETVIDLCSAPGSKTLCLAMQMRNHGHIIANDLSAKRLGLVKQNCLRLGITNVTFNVGDGRRFLPQTPVDAVLIDAPCSGLGVVGRRADRRWKKQERDISDLSQLQRELLDSGNEMVKLGGRMVYPRFGSCRI